MHVPLVHPAMADGRAKPDPVAWLRRAWHANPPLTIVGLAMLLTLAATVAGLFFDPRVITGAPAWLKPAKFAVSIAIYAFTLAWLLSFVRGHRRLVALVTWGVAAALVVEQALIVLQVVRGTTSHFNFATPFDSVVWTTMGLAITSLWGLNALAAILLLRQRLPDPVLGWALRLGLLIALVGMGLAFLMTVPTSEQRAALAATGAMPTVGAHTVGVPDGGPGLPIVGWSTTGGDLRAAHFLGLHALQALPLLAWLLGRLDPGRLPLRRVGLVWVAAGGYLGLTLLLAWQALRGQPLVAPDAATALVAAALVIAVAGAALGALRATPPGRRLPSAAPPA